ncbi:hypothetical protein TSACC_3669 [Terrimicrobium sacchariphilum]|uniref:Uncharacterized protein n=1 Tax=Terrimicrobium sacchariphilum TaxID=690879 RepID=A0A146GGN2_TERSA|nr:hypothetical protein [Terrimicrobium sacchariphilum]GAT35598.1 hypothetical protein TSACC_3669 [Terrimicrobium sacchariphilum]
MNITKIQANSLAELPEGYRTRAIAEIIGRINGELFKCFAVLKPEDTKFYREYIEDNSKDFAPESPEKICADDVIEFTKVLDETRERIEKGCLPLKRLYELQEQLGDKCDCPECQAKRGASGLAS